MIQGFGIEAALLAGQPRLANLCWIYNSNRLTIEGGTDITFTEDVAACFLARGWHVMHVNDPNDLDRLLGASPEFSASTDRH